MATLQIRKETNKVWRHVPSDALPYIVSKLYIKSDGDFIRVVEQGGSQRGQYNFADVSVYNIGGVAETFGSAQQLMERLEALNYIGFFYEGEVSPSELISSDVDNAIELGTDGKLFAPISGGAVDSVNGQTGTVVLDATDVSALSNDTTDYTDATTPLAGTEIALVEQGGTFKKVAVSEFGGGGGGYIELIHKQTTDQSLVSLSGTRQTLYSYLVPANTYAVGDVVRLRAISKKSGTTAGYITYIVIHTDTDPSGGTVKVVSSTNTSTTNRLVGLLDRSLIVKDTYTEHLRNDVNVGYDFALANNLQLSQTVIDWTIDQYVILAAIGNASDSAQCVYFELTKQ